MPNISKIVNVSVVSDPGTGEVAFPYNEYRSDPIRSVAAIEVVKMKTIEVSGIRLQIAAQVHQAELQAHVKIKDIHARKAGEGRSPYGMKSDNEDQED